MTFQRKETFIRAINDHSEEVRRCASEALEKYDLLTNFDQLIETFRDGDTPTRIKIIYTLGKLNSSKIITPLVQCLKSNNDAIRATAVRVLGELRHPLTLSPLLELLNDKSTSVKSQTAEAVGNFQDKRTTDHLVRFLSNSTKKEPILSAINSLGKIGDAGAESTLLKFTNHDDAEVRAAAITALGDLEI